MNRRIAWSLCLVLTAALLTVCTGGVGWAQTYARMNVTTVGGGVEAAGAPACNTEAQSQTDTSGGDFYYVAGEASKTYVAGRFNTPGTGYDLCKVALYLNKVVGDSTPTWAVTLEVRADNSGAPGTVLGTSSTSIGPGDVSTYPTYSAVEFAFSSSITLSASTAYWLVIKATALGDTGDYLNWGYDNDTWADSETSANGSTWSDVGNDHLAHIIYK